MEVRLSIISTDNLRGCWRTIFIYGHMQCAPTDNLRGCWRTIFIYGHMQCAPTDNLRGCWRTCNVPLRTTYEVVGVRFSYAGTCNVCAPADNLRGCWRTIFICGHMQCAPTDRHLFLRFFSRTRKKWGKKVSLYRSFSSLPRKAREC